MGKNPDGTYINPEGWELDSQSNYPYQMLVNLFEDFSGSLQETDWIDGNKINRIKFIDVLRDYGKEKYKPDEEGQVDLPYYIHEYFEIE